MNKRTMVEGMVGAVDDSARCRVEIAEHKHARHVRGGCGWALAGNSEQQESSATHQHEPACVKWRHDA